MMCYPLGSVLWRRVARLHPHSDAASVTVPIVQMRKVTLREVKWYVQGHGGSKCCNQGFTLQIGLCAQVTQRGNWLSTPGTRVSTALR